MKFVIKNKDKVMVMSTKELILERISKELFPDDKFEILVEIVAKLVDEVSSHNGLHPGTVHHSILGLPVPDRIELMEEYKPKKKRRDD